MTTKTLHIPAPFALEGGAVLPELHIAYTTYGRPNPAQDNIVWIAHALTANSEAAAWWPGLVGPGQLLDPERYYIVCANIIGSCYGSTGPASIHPNTGKPYGADFPLVTVKDIVRAHQLLQRHLGIQRIRLGMGGSMGGQQLLEWAATDPGLFDQLALLATNARHSPWGIAFNEAQRMAILADPSIALPHPDAGKRGLEAARAIAMLSYRHYGTYQRTQSESSHDKIEDFLATSYQQYQGQKLQRRFNAHSYLSLSKAMDSHNVGRGRDSIEDALARITARTLVVAIQSDILFPPEEQAFLARHIPHAHIAHIDSLYGHDGFLIEYDKIAPSVKALLEGKIGPPVDAGSVFPSPGFTKTGKLAVPGTEKF